MSDDYEDHMVQEVDETEEVEESEPEEEEVFEEETEAQEVEEESTEETQEAEENQDQEDSGDDEDYDKPVSEGDVVELEIEDLGSKGDGIARVEGFVVFVPGGEVDQKYDVEITSVGRKFAFGEITE
ncbi:MAG: deoxyribonuclease [Nanohaloarchaea archaeon SW_7_46_7]|nr:MAG: deoxyribonuclease [Nanohaloarchaea archaeon SW_7_46_7]